MFGIGFSEILLIAVVALVFFGPKRLPELMRQGGRIFVQMRRAANDVRSTFDHVIRQAEDELRAIEREKLMKSLELQSLAQEHEKMQAQLSPVGTESHPTDLHPTSEHESTSEKIAVNPADLHAEVATDSSVTREAKINGAPSVEKTSPVAPATPDAPHGAISYDPHLSNPFTEQKV